MPEHFSPKFGRAIAEHGRYQFISFVLSGAPFGIPDSSAALEGQWRASASELLRFAVMGIISWETVKPIDDVKKECVTSWVARSAPDGPRDSISLSELQAGLREDAWDLYPLKEKAELADQLLKISSDELPLLAWDPYEYVPDPTHWQRFAELFGISQGEPSLPGSSAERIRVSFLAAGVKTSLLAGYESGIDPTEVNLMLGWAAAARDAGLEQ